MSTSKPPSAPAPETARQLEECLATLRQTLSSLKYGTVAITVHEGRIVQMDVTERRRLSPN